MPTKNYKAIKLIQQPDSPPFYMTSAPASEILEWCDVPRAKGDYMAGYQRLLNVKRTERLQTYLELSPRNIIPGAIIIAVDNNYVQVEELGNGLCSVSITEDTRDFKTKLEELRGSFTTRLNAEELTSAGITFVEDDGFVEADEGVETEDDVEDVDADDESKYPISYLASLAKELSIAVNDWSTLSEKRQKAIESYIEGVSKPGLIIDGQHRVYGAKNVSKCGIILPVILLPGLEFAEQVFQFYVLNSTARPLKHTELRRIVSTSLTNAEIDNLYGRFRTAGIYADEARWTLELDTSPLSPFRSRIDFGYGNIGAVIPENVADQLVRGFMNMSKSKYRQLIDPLGDLWEDTDARLKMFFWFWTAIKQEYAKAWEGAESDANEGRKAQLFMKVSLLTLQEFVLDRFVTALPYKEPGTEPPLKSQASVSAMVASTLKNLPQSFFQREWKKKQMDTSEGRKVLYETMEKVWAGGGKVSGKLSIFRG